MQMYLSINLVSLHKYIFTMCLWFFKYKEKLWNLFWMFMRISEWKVIAFIRKNLYLSNEAKKLLFERNELRIMSLHIAPWYQKLDWIQSNNLQSTQKIQYLYKKGKICNLSLCFVFEFRFSLMNKKKNIIFVKYRIII